MDILAVLTLASGSCTTRKSDVDTIPSWALAARYVVNPSSGICSRSLIKTELVRGVD